MTELHADPMALLRTRTSTKWASYPPDVLPLFVAEMDFPLATPIAAHLIGMIGRGDLGYDSRRPAIGEAFAGFAHDRWGWDFDPATLRWTTNVMVAITELLRSVIEPGDAVVVNTPVYGPFFWAIDDAKGVRVDVPLVEVAPTEWEIDLEGLEAAFAAGAKAFILCNPHNPIGIPHSREQLERVAELAAQYDVVVISNEIHGAIVHSDGVFTPYLDVSDAARATGVAVTSASKAFNIPGLTSAYWIPGSPEAAKRIAGISPSVVHRVSHLGTHAATVAFTSARDWLDSALETIEANRYRLRDLLAEQLPEAVLHEPRATYLAWIDFRALGWGDEPHRKIVKEAKVALSGGTAFGVEGTGFARINIACAPETLDEAIGRIARLR